MSITLSNKYPSTPQYYYTISTEWTIPTGVDHYRLMWGTSSGLNESSTNIKVKKFNSFNKTNLNYNTTYYFKVYAYSLTGSTESTIPEEQEAGMKILDISNELIANTKPTSPPVGTKDDIIEDILFDTNIPGGYSSGADPLFLYVNADPSNNTIYFTNLGTPNENALYSALTPYLPFPPNPSVFPTREYIYDPDPELSGAYKIQVNQSPIPGTPPVPVEVDLTAPFGTLVKCFMVDPDNLIFPAPIPPNANFIYPPSVAIAAYPTLRIAFYPYLIPDPVLKIPIPSPILPDPKLLQLNIFCRISDDYTEGNGVISNPIKFVFPPVQVDTTNKIYIKNMQDPDSVDWYVEVVESKESPPPETGWQVWDCDNDYIVVPTSGRFVYSAYARTVKVSDNTIKSTPIAVTRTSGFLPN